MTNLSWYWDTKWRKVKDERENPFARRCVRLFPKFGVKTILDIGCGSGVDALYFARKGYMVTAVDVSPEALQQLRARLRESRIRTVTLLRRNVAKRLPFPNLSFDCVHAHLSLHFFDDRTAAKIIGEAWRVLRRGGIICVKCKSVHDQLYGKGTRVDNDMYYYGHTRHFFSKEYMKERLGRFHIVAMRASSSQYHGKLSAFIEAIAQKKL